jgi:hypothetical protein
MPGVLASMKVRALKAGALGRGVVAAPADRNHRQVVASLPHPPGCRQLFPLLPGIPLLACGTCPHRRSRCPERSDDAFADRKFQFIPPGRPDKEIGLNMSSRTDRLTLCCRWGCHWRRFRTGLGGALPDAAATGREPEPGHRGSPDRAGSADRQHAGPQCWMVAIVGSL